MTDGPLNLVNMNKDSRNVMRGKCKTNDCDCTEYCYNKTRGNNCDYCNCPPTKHENLDIMNVKNEIVPLIMRIDETIVVDDYMDLLREIEEAFKFLHDAYDKFLEIYPIWRKNRLEKIRALKDLADALDKLKFNCNITKATASSVALSSGILTVIASLCLFFAAPVVIPFTPLALIGMTSCLVDGGAVLVDHIKKKRSVAAIKKIFEEDQAHCAALVDFIECGKKCNEAIEKLMDFNTFRKLWDILSLINNDYSTAEEQHIGLASYINAHPRLEELKKFLKICPNLFSLLHNTLNMQRSNPNVLQSINISSKLCLETVQFVDSAFDVTSLFIHSAKTVATTGKVAVQAGGKLVGKSAIKAGFHGGIAGVCLIFDVVSLHVTVKDMKKGSKSDIAENIRAVVSYMEGDIEQLDSVYTSVAKYKLEQSVYNIIKQIGYRT